MKPLFALLFCAAVYSCESPSDKIMKEFKKVNDSLTQPGEKILAVNGYTYYYNRLLLKEPNHPGRLETAKVLFATMQVLAARIDSVQELLRTTDSVGETVGVAEKILIHTPLGDSLRKAMLEASDRCYAALLSPDKKPALDSIFSTVKEYTTPGNWNGGVFSETPTVAAQTILSALESRCMNAASLTMKDIDENLK